MTKEVPLKIEKYNIEALPIEMGGTEIVLQRHGKYERLAGSPNIGSLTEEGAEGISNLSKEFFDKLFAQIPEDERDKVDILVIGSDTQFMEGGYRSIETANLVMEALKEELKELKLDENQLLNTSGRYSGEGGVRPTPKLREPQMFENSMGFVNFLKEKYGDLNKDFWIAFEEDLEKETREKMGAEGPDEIADRLKFMVEVLMRYSRMYHKKNPDRRLVIWAATHYDTISPYTKREIFDVGKEVPLAVDYGAGLSIIIDPEGNATTKIEGDEYEIS